MILQPKWFVKDEDCEVPKTLELFPDEVVLKMDETGRQRTSREDVSVEQISIFDLPSRTKLIRLINYIKKPDSQDGHL